MMIRLLQIKNLLFFVFFLFATTACMQNFKFSDKAIAEFYVNKDQLPSFAFSDTLNHRIHYAFSKDSSKPLLLLIHGAPGAWFGYKEFFKDSLLMNKYQIITPDRAGYNKSSQVTASVALQANLLRPLIENAQRRTVVLGRSYGAAIAAKLAMDNPDLVDELILVAPACDPQKEKFWWFSKPVNSKFARFFLPKYANRASDEKFAHREELEKLLLDWKKVKCPVTILQGGKDWIIEPSNGAFVDSVLNTKKRFIFLPENGHLITTERYELIREILLGL
jgi:pimeloyl-ACP methyl ester carboxylesterase